MKIHRHSASGLAALAILAGTTAGYSGGARAALHQTVTGSAQLGDLSVTDTNWRPTQAVGSSSAALSVQQFDADLGVLTSATYRTDDNGQLVQSGNAAAGNTTRYTETVTLGGFSSARSITSLSGNGSADLGPWNVGRATALDSLVGTGTIDGSLSGSARASLTTQSGEQATTAFIGGHGTTVSVDYGYLGHANASFSLASDSNAFTWDPNTSDGKLKFYALGTAATTTRMDFVSMTCTGDCGDFLVSGYNQQDMAAGATRVMSTRQTDFGTGLHQATYHFVFSDNTSVGALSSQRTTALDLTLSNVVPSVPEPASGWLLLAGLGVMGVVGRRRQPR